MILNSQKNNVTSGTLFSILRPSEGARTAEVVVVMAGSMWPPALRLPDWSEERWPEGGQLEHEPAAISRLEDDVTTTRPREPACERQAEPRAGAVAGSAHAGVEDALAQRGVDARTVVAHRKADAPVAGGELDPDL